MIFLLSIVWLSLGIWGTYIGHQYMKRHYDVGLFEDRFILAAYVVLTLGGPINLIIATARFWKR